MQGLMQQLTGGSLNMTSILVWTLLAAVLAIAGGALAGILLAGKDLGNQLAAMMGGMFGPVAVVPGVFLGLIILKLI